ncbi:hypothetical protein L6164_023675 [Bauhinia variegata]|uniref:Uncharacterized protein n=1 Tax=Bauhinia variegata TaxID=167791 RepID=A0ACB9MJ90_BAUVA|nr:hypothetical protein L6164_023675 [Bauhinia variegata]
MIIATLARNKLGFINGEVPRPAEKSLFFSAWSPCNFMVISGTRNALSKEIAESELIEKFEQAIGTMIFQIQKELFSISQGTEIVSSYYTRIKRIWDELKAFQAFPECSCGSAKALTEYLEDQKLFQIFMQ